MEEAISPPRRRSRALLITLLILLLILLPLYLWPLRGATGGLSGASTLFRALRDPRSAAALAGIPIGVWDALMGRAETPPPPSPAAKVGRNLTMISEFEHTRGEGEVGPPGALNPEVLAPDMIVARDPLDPSPMSEPGPPGTGEAWPVFVPGGHPSLDGLGPWPGGSAGGPTFVGPSALDAGAPAAPMPTPEPATLMLVGSNLALLGAALWRRQRGRSGHKESPPIG